MGNYASMSHHLERIGLSFDVVMSSEVTTICFVPSMWEMSNIKLCVVLLMIRKWRVVMVHHLHISLSKKIKSFKGLLKNGDLFNFLVCELCTRPFMNGRKVIWKKSIERRDNKSINHTTFGQYQVCPHIHYISPQLIYFRSKKHVRMH